MRIAVVAEPFVPIPPPMYGGIEQMIFHLMRGLKEAGHHPVLLGTADSSIEFEIIPIVDNALSFAVNSSDVKLHAELVRKARRTTEKQLRAILPDIDIIHSHGFDLSKFKDFPSVTTLHNPIKFANFAYYKSHKELPYVSISKNYQNSFPDLNYVDVVYNGEDPRDFPIVTKPQDYVCFLGRFDQNKNPHLAIELAISLGIKIKLAGKLDYRGEGYFEHEIKKYLKHPLVEYLGELGMKEKIKLLSNAKCNLHPTNFREPFGLTVIEAAYCGTPTMAIARGSMPELIEEGRTGLLVEDFVEGAHHIEECYNMDRNYVASRARQLFNYQLMTREYIEVYKKVLRTHPKPRLSGNRALDLLTNLKRKLYS